MTNQEGVFTSLETLRTQCKVRRSVLNWAYINSLDWGGVLTETKPADWNTYVAKLWGKLDPITNELDWLPPSLFLDKANNDDVPT